MIDPGRIWTANSRSPPDLGGNREIYTGSGRRTQDFHSIWTEILRSPPDLGEELEMDVIIIVIIIIIIFLMFKCVFFLAENEQVGYKSLKKHGSEA